MEILYLVTRQDALRGNLHILLGRPANFLALVPLPAIMTGSAYMSSPSVQASAHLYSPHFWWLPALFFGFLTVWVSLMLSLIRQTVNVHYAETDPPLVSRTALTPEALEDTKREMKNKHILSVPLRVLWQDVTRIEWHEGDFYIWRKKGCSIIPRTAFENPRHAQGFLELAEQYWKAAKHGTATPDAESAWPPAPRSGGPRLAQAGNAAALLRRRLAFIAGRVSCR